MYCDILLAFLIISVIRDLVDWGGRGPAALPVVIWHGVNDNAKGIHFIVRSMKEVIPELYVHNVMIGSNNYFDQLNSFLMPAHKQIDHVCEAIQADSRLAAGYNGVGISQGGLLIRGLAQRCPNPPMRTLVTYGAPSSGIFGIPNCEHTTGSVLLCETVRELMDDAVYNPLLQDLVTPAQYWRDPFNETEFIKGSTFLADINNLKEEKNQQYKDVISGLANLIMIAWKEDTTIIPRESSHFGYYIPGQDNLTRPLEETPLYLEDWLGLRTLDETGRLHKFSLPGNHMNMQLEWFKQNVVKPFLTSTL